MKTNRIQKCMEKKRHVFVCAPENDGPAAVSGIRRLFVRMARQ